MGLEADIRTALLTMDAVTALVGAGSLARIRPDRLHEDDTFPAIIVEVDRETPQNDISGVGGLRISSVNLICRATTRAGSRALAEAVRVNGTNPGTGLAGYTSATLDAVLESMTTGFVPKDDGSDQGWYDTNMDFTTIQTETT